MRNLAGDKQSDAVIRRELERCRILVVDRDVKCGNPEVAQTITGNLPGFEIHRAWYYWVVSGRVPLAVAQEIYADPVGKTDVRVAGHCGCPAPEAPWVDWLTDDGKEVISTKDYEECRAMGERLKWPPEILAKYAVSDDPPSIAKPYVTSYHIDSEIGLRLFVDTLRKHGVLPDSK
jgi:hypothetical protein